MNFSVKSAEVLAQMNEVELQKYYVEKLTWEQNQLKEKMSALEEAAKKDAGLSDDLRKEIEGLKAKEVESLRNAVKQQGVILGKLQDGSLAGSQVKSVEDSVKKALGSLKGDERKMFLDGNKRISFDIDKKAVGDMTFAGSVTGTMPQAVRLPGINNIAERSPKVYDLIPKLTVSGNTVEWAFERNQEGAADGTAEAAAKNQIDNEFAVSSVTLLKQTAYFRVSTEMLEDDAMFESWFRNKLIVRLFIRVDAQVLGGDGTGTNLNGLITQATTFAAGAFASSVDNANEVDVIAAAVNQIKIAEQDASNLAIIMHPSDVTALKFEKVSSTDKRYVQRVLQAGSTMNIDGYPIIETTAITQGDFLVGAMNKALILEKGGITVEMGRNGNDFRENMMTILAEWRGEVLIETNDTTCFVKGTFSTAEAALETP